MTICPQMFNFCARVVTGKRRYDHISGAMLSLGWFTAKQLVAYHTLCAVNRTMRSGHPDSLLRTFGQRARQRHDHQASGRICSSGHPCGGRKKASLLPRSVADERQS